MNPPGHRAPAWRRYLRFWRADVAADVDEELRFHLESRTEDLVASGLDADAATAQAMGELGNMSAIRSELRRIDERARRTARRWERWSQFAADVRYAARRLLATKGFALATILTLGFAIGATASVFSVVDAVLIKPFPYRDVGRVFTLWESSSQFPQFAVAPGNYTDWKNLNTLFFDLAASQVGSRTVTGLQEPERITTIEATPSYAATLGVTPLVGRFFSADSGGPSEAVLGFGYWQRHFGGTTSVLGRSIILDTHPYVIVGVMPPGLPSGAYYDGDVWTRLSFASPNALARDDHRLAVFGRLKAGVRASAAQVELGEIAKRLALAYPQTNKDWSVVTVPLSEQIVRGVKATILMLFAAAACVLLIGVANLSNLFFIRYLARARELGVRAALGASRLRLTMELVTEAALIGVAASVLGVGLATGGVKILRALAPATWPRLADVTMDSRVAVFCVVAAMAAVILLGLLPALQALRFEAIDVVRGVAHDVHHQQRVHNGLVVLQVTVALALVTGAGLFADSFERLRNIDPGFRSSGVLTAQLGFSGDRYSTPQKVIDFTDRLVRNLSSAPDVRAASVSVNLPTALVYSAGFSVVGDPSPDAAHQPSADLVCASPDYFRTMGIALEHGRGVLQTDTKKTPEVVLVDALLAAKFLQGRDPVGQRLAFGTDTTTIVGVVAPVKQRGLVASDVPVVYAPFAQCDAPIVFVEVRGLSDGSNVLPILKREVSRLDPTLPVFDVRAMTERVASSTGSIGLSTFLGSLFAVVALALSVIGLYSVLSYVVSQRRRELGVRIALGASHSQIMSAVLSQAAMLAGIGIVLGVCAAWIITRVLATLFVGVSPHEPTVFLGATGLFICVALAAAADPALRATRVDPKTAIAGLT